MHCIPLVRNRIRVLPGVFRHKDAAVCVTCKDAVCVRLSATHCMCIIMCKHLKYFVCVLFCLFRK